MTMFSHQRSSNQSQTQSRTSWVEPSVFFTIAVGMFIIGALIDPLLGSSLTADVHPDFGLAGLLKMTCSVLSALFFVEGLVLIKYRVQPSPSKSTTQEKLIPDAEGWGAVGILTVSLFDSVKRPIKLLTIKESIIWMVLTLSSSFSFGLLSVPWLFSLLGKEDGFIERLSVWLWFLCCGILLYVLFRFQRAPIRQRKGYLFGLLALFVTCFFIGMGKVSWLHHLFSVKAAQAFAGNFQETFSLLHTSSYPSQNLFHLVAFLFLIALPFLHDQTSLLKRSETISFFIPSRFILLVSSIMVAYNYGMWNLLWTQWGFFVTLFILLYYAWSYSTSTERISLPLVLLGFVAATQSILLLNGGAISQAGVVQNYKELFIPLAFLFYSLEVLQKTGMVCHAPESLKTT